MNTKYSIIILLLITLVAMISCHPTDDRLIVINNSDKNIFAALSYEYPDTTIPKYHNPNNGHTIKPRELINIPVRCCWEGLFAKTMEGKIGIFIYDNSTIQIIPMDTIRDKYLILKRYDLTYDSLNKAHWVVNYP